MDKNIHPVAATFVVIIAVLGVGGWFWATGEARTFGGPAGLATAPNGHLYIQINNQLLEHDNTGAFVARHDLADIGVDLFLGGFDFFSNGDLLLRRGPDTRSFLDNVRAFQRLANNQSISPDETDTGLYRCSLDTGHCESFASPPIDFKAAFSVFIDRASDDVYISDSSRHTIRKYSQDGEELAPPVDDFRFPNQLLIHDRALYVADTNHHAIRMVSTDNDRFGEDIERVSVTPEVARKEDQRWPSHFVRVGDSWWVNNMQTGMDYGGIYSFDDRWSFDRRVELPESADPIALIVFNGEVLISDWYGDRVHRIGFDGTPLGNFYSPGLIEVLDEFREERTRFNIYAWLIAALSAAFTIVLVIKGTNWNEPRERRDDSAPPGPSNEPRWFRPDTDNVKRMRRGMHLGRWFFIPTGLLILWLAWSSEDPAITMDLVVGSLSFFAIYYLADWMARVNFDSAIYFAGDSVTLYNHEGRAFKEPKRRIWYTDTVVASDEVAVMLGQGNNPIYDRPELLRELSFRLPATQRISAWEMTRKLIAMRHPNGVLMLFALGLLAAGLLYYFVRFVATA